MECSLTSARHTLAFMEVHLSQDQEAFVQEAIHSGRLQTAALF
jgi:hypothetical protein